VDEKVFEDLHMNEFHECRKLCVCEGLQQLLPKCIHGGNRRHVTCKARQICKKLQVHFYQHLLAVFNESDRRKGHTVFF